MKHVIFGISGMAVTIFVLLSLLAVEGRSSRERELTSAVRFAARQALSDAFESENYPLDDDKELIADFQEILLDKISPGEDPNLNLVVDIIKADLQKGLLSVSVMEQFTHPNGKIGMAEASASVIVEREREKKSFSTTYQIPWQVAKEQGLPFVRGKESVYQVFSIEEGRCLRTPNTLPDSETKGRFVSWLGDDGKTYSSSQLLSLSSDRDRQFLAQYR